jgi:hypothetical protein
MSRTLLVRRPPSNAIFLSSAKPKVAEGAHPRAESCPFVLTNPVYVGAGTNALILNFSLLPFPNQRAVVKI